MTAHYRKNYDTLPQAAHEDFMAGLVPAAKIEAKPTWNPDPLEPRPWLSWSDCHVRDRICPACDLGRLENLPFSKWATEGSLKDYVE